MLWPDEPTIGGIPLRGRLLVAAPPLVDPNFDRTVVLVLEHGEDGALGVVLNRPSGTELEEALPDWDAFATKPSVVFVGGPVCRDSVIALARRGATAAGWVSVVGDLGTIDLGVSPSDGAAGLAALRVFVGYSGWSPGQLEAEIEQGGWFIVDAEPTDPFAAHPDTLWRDVLRRQRGRLRIFAMCPEDPSTN
ncbi:MAG: YqgE/AlgH family protein [Actinomycetota bacterium]